MGGKKTEACGRCSISTVVEANGESRDVLGEERIEVDEREMRRMSAHHIAASRAKAWFDNLGRRLTFGR